MPRDHAYALDLKQRLEANAEERESLLAELQEASPDMADAQAEEDHLKQFSLKHLHLTDESGRRLGVFPDFICCRMPVFDDTALKTDYEIRLHLSVDPVKKNFSLRTVKSDVTAAVQESLQQIRELLQDVGCPVFLGQP